LFSMVRNQQTSGPSAQQMADHQLNASRTDMVAVAPPAAWRNFEGQ
jgi:hypothetical protein